MGLIYKPNPALMSPQGVCVPPAGDITFKIPISGVSCNGYKITMTDMTHGNYFSTPVTTIPGSDLYGGDTLEVSINASSFYMRAGRQYSWSCSLYSSIGFVERYTGGDDSSVVISFPNGVLTDGDTISFVSVGGNIPSTTEEGSIYYVRNLGDKYYIYPTYVGAMSDATSNPGKQIKWAGTISDGGSFAYTVAQSQSVVIDCYDIPSLTVSPPGVVNSISHEFVATYLHPQGVGVSSYNAYLYDGDGNIVESIEGVRASDIKHVFDGMRPGNYGIRFSCTNTKNQQADTGIINFVVNYDMPVSSILLSAENDYCNSSVVVKWAKPTINTGVATGDISYVQNYSGADGDVAIRIENSAEVAFPINQNGDEHTVMFDWSPLYSNFDGDMCRLEDGLGNTLSIGYVAFSKAFYARLDGENGYVVWASGFDELYPGFIYSIKYTSLPFLSVSAKPGYESTYIVQDETTSVFYKLSLSGENLVLKEVGGSPLVTPIFLEARKDSDTSVYELRVESGNIVLSPVETTAEGYLLKDEITSLLYSVRWDYFSLISASDMVGISGVSVGEDALYVHFPPPPFDYEGYIEQDFDWKRIVDKNWSCKSRAEIITAADNEDVGKITMYNPETDTSIVVVPGGKGSFLHSFDTPSSLDGFTKIRIYGPMDTRVTFKRLRVVKGDFDDENVMISLKKAVIS